ncbi:FtsK/SpoIIIE domain-containing protein [Butyrivibrio sp. AE2032]|uniref:FtsK/SpoIIIE domain-containing protein n=1 Tax=Butyrivibrio sp. AE2032 TaxID=1458463 RepID=UPI0005511082|nr:FtsK/SpoIIIE domain-containing protein [Butyrivibrio sp. AE2032]
MESIEKLNAEYLDNRKYLNTLEICIKDIMSLKSRVGFLSTHDCLSEIMRTVEPVIKCLNADNSQCFFDLHSLTESGVRYAESISKFKEALFVFAENNKDVSYKRASEHLQNSQKEFETLRNTFFDKYNVCIDSEQAIIGVFIYLLDNEMNNNLAKKDHITSQAKEIIAGIDSLELHSEWPNKVCVELPDSMPLARKVSSVKPCELLSALGVKVEYSYFDVHIRSQGNVLVETNFEQTLDKELDYFVLAYVFKFLESFPIGMANVLIFDRNPNILNQRLSNIIKEGNYSERTKKTISLFNYTSLSELNEVTRIITDDILKKTSYEYPDLYSIHAIDSSDPFTLIVLRDGLLDQGGHATSSILDNINALTRPNDAGHVSGIRFLIIDDSSSSARSLSEGADFLIKSIKNNCEIRLEYSDKKFVYDGESVEVIHIVDEVNGFVQRRSTELAQKITNLEKQYVSVSETSKTDVKDPRASIFRIPIGKSGNTIVEIPLSCKDDKGSVDGQCIGYMVIGQSGSGKSSFFHSVVINGCLQYSPADLQFWLLDFKYGGASSKYRKSQIPHVRVVAENNKIDDALCLFQMIFDEMEYRNKLINRHMVDNIIDYNSLVEEKNRLPRIVIMIDEVQEIFRDENAAELQRMISSISVRMRSVGMHFIMVAQNLSEGKSYMLKEAFLPSATGRICFRVADSMPRESGFDESFIQRKNEISVLSTGEAYVSWGKDTIKKVKMAYASPDDMNNQLFVDIKNRYPDYSYLKPMVIGSKKRLAVTDFLQTGEHTYLQEMVCLSSKQISYDALVGEDSYRMSPLKIEFSPYENSSLLLLGDDKEIASSLCTSIALSLARQKVHIHLFNADRIKSQYDGGINQHPFAYLCGLAKRELPWVDSHTLNEFANIVKQIYVEYNNRLELVQKSDEDENPAFESICLIVNDLFGIQQFISNDYLEETANSAGSQSNAKFDFSILEATGFDSKTTSFKEKIQDALIKLVKDGYRYNINIVLAIKGDPGLWRNMRPTDVNKVILFNPTQYAGFVDNQFYVREMLKNITPETGSETLAVCINKKHVSKMRPLIYDMSNQNEVGSIDSLMEVSP